MKNVGMYFLAILTGILTGIVTIPYRYLIEKSIYIRKIIFADKNSFLIHIEVLLGLYLIVLLINKFVEILPLISGSGIPQARAQTYGRFKMKYPVKDFTLKFIGGILGISSGFSLGREGPSVQVGALIGEWISKVFNVNKIGRKYLIMSGSSAGLSSAFTAPLASTLFIAEELEKFFNYRLIIFSFLGAITSGFMASKVFTDNIYLQIPRVFPNNFTLGKYIVIIILFSGFISVIGKSFTSSLIYFQKLYYNAKLNKYVKLFLITLSVYLMGTFFIDLTAGGESYLIKVVKNDNISFFMLGIAIVIKLLFSTLSYATGFPGGIFLPLLVTGGLSGKLFGLFLVYFNIIEPINIGIFVLLGMAGAFIVVVRSPVTGIILLLEMTNNFNMLPLLTLTGACVYIISYIMDVKPIYDILYEIIKRKDNNKGTVELVFEIGSNSYFDNMKIKDVVLPENCKITSLERRKSELVLKDNLLIETSDIIGITVDRIDIEKFYNVFRTMANEV